MRFRSNQVAFVFVLSYGRRLLSGGGCLCWILRPLLAHGRVQFSAGDLGCIVFADKMSEWCDSLAMFFVPGVGLLLALFSFGQARKGAPPWFGALSVLVGLCASLAAVGHLLAALGHVWPTAFFIVVIGACGILEGLAWSLAALQRRRSGRAVR